MIMTLLRSDLMLSEDLFLVWLLTRREHVFLSCYGFSLPVMILLIPHAAECDSAHASNLPKGP